MGTAELVSGVTTFLLLLLIWLSATLYIVKQFFFSGREEDMLIHKWLRLTSLGYLCSYTLAYFFILLLTGLALSSNESFYTGTIGWNSLFFMIMLFGAIGFISHYLFLSTQVYYSFKPTQYRISITTMEILISLCIINAILLIIYATSYFIRQSALFLALPIALIAVILNVFIVGSLVYLFANRLTKLAADHERTAPSAQVNELDPKQSSLD